MANCWNCQSTSPEMLVSNFPLTAKLRKSNHSSEETFHQKVKVPGPLTVLSSSDCWLSLIAPLCAATIPSWVILVWANQGALPWVIQVRLGASSAGPSGKDVGRTTTVATRLVTAWEGLLTRTE